jgi:3'-5' exoribonuclease
LHDKLQQVPDFPPKLRVLVEHLIVSHHGELEYGSPKVPLFPEAMLLHHLDNLDSKMECMRALAEKDRHIEGFWTGYSPSLERSILKKAKYLEDAPARDVPPITPPGLSEAPLPAPAAVPEPLPAVEQHQTRFAPSSSPFAEKLQQAWRKDS